MSREILRILLGKETIEVMVEEVEEGLGSREFVRVLLIFVLF